MPVHRNKYVEIVKLLKDHHATLVAVSKTKPAEDIIELYNLGHRDFGENYVQELVEKEGKLPRDIRWHFIGHLQTNKVKFIAPFIHLVHGVDSLKLLREIDKQAAKSGKIINVLLQVFIAKEASKFGLDEKELAAILDENAAAVSDLAHIRIRGLMGMASFTEDENIFRREFRYLKSLFDRFSATQSHNCKMEELSMGMSSDFKVALEEGSTLVRIGSLIFGERELPADLLR